MWDWIEKFATIASLLVGVISVIVASVSVYYSKKAYEVATDIFNKGIQLDKEKILKDVGLNFVTGFIKPFYQFRKSTNLIWPKIDLSKEGKSKPTTVGDEEDDGSMLQLGVNYVCQLLKSKEFDVNISHYEQNKGDVWNALEGEGKNQGEAFAAITKFEEETEVFSNSMSYMIGYLEKYLNEKDGLHSKDSISQLFDNCPGSRELFGKAGKMLDEVEKSIQGLPDELKVNEVMEKLGVDE